MSQHSKIFKIAAADLKPLVTARGTGIASDKITVDGLPVGYMYREDPDSDHDSGWRFLSGTEDQDYADDASNFAYYSLNTIANYDQAISPHLDETVGSQFERVPGQDAFRRIS